MLEVLVNIAFKEVVLIHISVSVGNVSRPICIRRENVIIAVIT